MMDASEVAGLVHDACTALDERRFDDFLGICADDFRYRLTVYSPELRKQMVWLDADKQELHDLYALLPQQVRMNGILCRFANVTKVGPTDDAGDVPVSSAVTIYSTDTDGATRLLAVGRYDDVVTAGGSSVALRRRELRLHTRMLGPGSLEPL